MGKMNDFVEFFASTALYAELNKQYTTFEIFEINAAKFEIEIVQQTYERFIKQTHTTLKRIGFAKDLNQMIEGKHTFIPNELTWEQAQKISNDPEFFEYWQSACNGDSGEDCACLAIKAIHKALIQSFHGAAI